MSHAGLTVKQINAIIWTCDAVAIFFTAGRLYIRGKIIKHFYLDDAVHILAMVCMIIQSGLYTGGEYLLEVLNAYKADKKHNPYPNLVLLQQLNIASATITFTCYWGVKVSILLFYRQLFSVSKRFMKAWWIVMAYTILTFWVAIATCLSQCGGDSTKITNTAVCNSKASVALQKRIYKVSFSMNISSDVAIMALALVMLSRVHIRTPQKLGIGLMFSLTLVIIAFEILRMVKSLKGSGSDLNIVWASTEASMAVIISCLPTFKVLTHHMHRIGTTKSSSVYDQLAASKEGGRSEGTKGSAENQSANSKSERDFSHDIQMENNHARDYV